MGVSEVRVVATNGTEYCDISVVSLQRDIVFTNINPGTSKISHFTYHSERTPESDGDLIHYKMSMAAEERMEKLYGMTGPPLEEMSGFLSPFVDFIPRDIDFGQLKEYTPLEDQRSVIYDIRTCDEYIAYKPYLVAPASVRFYRNLFKLSDIEGGPRVDIITDCEPWIAIISWHDNQDALQKLGDFTPNFEYTFHQFGDF